MQTATYKLRRQVGGRGAFAIVTLDVYESSPPGTIEVDATDKVSQQYVPAAMTGIQFAQTQLVLEGQNSPTTNVIIREIIENPADTNHMMVVYAAANAYCNSIGMQLERTIEFNGEDHTLIFPMGRATNE